MSCIKRVPRLSGKGIKLRDSTSALENPLQFLNKLPAMYSLPKHKTKDISHA